MKAAEENHFALLSADDPTPVEWVNERSDAPVILLCEHAGNTLPTSHNQLGLSGAELNSHIGWDIGACAVARQVAEKLQVPLLLQHYSRLLIDCNRPPGSSESIPAMSDSIQITANHSLSTAEKTARLNEIFQPLDDAINDALTRSQRRAAFSIHSFTPQMQGQAPRPWHAGFLSRTDHHTGNTLLSHIKEQRPELTLALNEPYSIDDDTDWFVPRYAEPKALAHSLIEIRNDQLLDDKGINTWAELLASAINTVIEDIT